MNKFYDCFGKPPIAEKNLSGKTLNDFDHIERRGNWTVGIEKENNIPVILKWLSSDDEIASLVEASACLRNELGVYCPIYESVITDNESENVVVCEQIEGVKLSDYFQKLTIDSEQDLLRAQAIVEDMIFIYDRAIKPLSLGVETANGEIIQYCHQDLQDHNLILDEQGNIALIDIEGENFHRYNRRDEVDSYIGDLVENRREKLIRSVMMDLYIGNQLLTKEQKDVVLESVMADILANDDLNNWRNAVRKN